MRFISAFVYDVKLQFRHGFYYAYALVCVVYMLLLQALPPSFRETTATLLTFSDPSVLGFFFIGGLVLLEKGQNIHDNLFVTPYKLEEYLGSKTLSLTVLSLLSSLAIHISAFGVTSHLFAFMVGIGLTSSFFTLIGLGVAARSQTMNGFFLRSMLYTTVFFVPLLEVMGGWSSPLFALMPPKASLMLIGAAFAPLHGAGWIYALAVLVAWNILAYVWTRRLFDRHILLKIGEVEFR